MKTIRVFFYLKFSVFILDMKRAYDVFDYDRDGRLSVSELGDVLRYLNLNPTQAEIEEIMKQADTDGEIITFDIFGIPYLP